MLVIGSKVTWFIGNGVLFCDLTMKIKSHKFGIERVSNSWGICHIPLPFKTRHVKHLYLLKHLR